MLFQKGQNLQTRKEHTEGGVAEMMEKMKILIIKMVTLLLVCHQSMKVSIEPGSLLIT